MPKEIERKLKRKATKKRTQQETNRRLRLWNAPQDRLEGEKEKDVTSSPNMPRNTTARKRMASAPSTTDPTTEK